MRMRKTGSYLFQADRVCHSGRNRQNSISVQNGGKTTQKKFTKANMREKSAGFRSRFCVSFWPIFIFFRRSVISGEYGRPCVENRRLCGMRSAMTEMYAESYCGVHLHSETAPVFLQFAKTDVNRSYSARYVLTVYAIDSVNIVLLLFIYVLCISLLLYIYIYILQTNFSIYNI